MAVPEFKDTETIYEEMKADAASELPQLTNWRDGGVIRGIVYILAKALAIVYTVIRDALYQAFVGTANEDYLDDKAADFGTTRQPKTKTKGEERFYRSGSSGNVNIPAGTLVATQTTAAGEQLVYPVDENTLLPDGETEVQVPIIAIQGGAKYNVGQSTIIELLTPVAGIDGVINDRSPSWIDTIGTDEETDAELRARLLIIWDAISIGSTRETYRAWALEINGVEEVAVDDTQPRGEGTVDVIILATGGVAPTQELIDEVQALIDARRPLCSDVLVKGPDLVPVALDITITKHPHEGEETAVKSDVEGALNALFTKNEAYPDVSLLGIGDDLKLARIFQVVMSRNYVIDCAVNSPADDVIIDFDEKATLDSLSIITQTATET